MNDKRTDPDPNAVGSNPEHATRITEHEFTIDLVRDPHAVAALKSYAAICGARDPVLAGECRHAIDMIRERAPSMHATAHKAPTRKDPTPNPDAKTIGNEGHAGNNGVGVPDAQKNDDASATEERDSGVAGLPPAQQEDVDDQQPLPFDARDDAPEEPPASDGSSDPDAPPTLPV